MFDFSNANRCHFMFAKFNLIWYRFTVVIAKCLGTLFSGCSVQIRVFQKKDAQSFARNKF